MARIPFNVPFIAGDERKYIDEVFDNGHFAGNGPFTAKVQTWLQNHLGAKKVLLTHSCTAGLEIAAILNKLGPGDEVLIPSFTFVTTASSVMRSGAIPVFCEIDPMTMLIDLNDAKTRVTNNTKAIMPVHYAGFSPDMDAVLTFAQEHNLAVIEDAAQGLGSTWNGKRLGTFAPLAAISFHETKNIHCGLGGCLIINDDDLVDKAEIVWERGTDRSAFFKGFVDKYSWQEVGSSFYPSEFQAAFLLAQLEAMERNLQLRHKLWAAYSEGLADLESRGCLRVLRPPEGCEHNAHMMAIVLPTPEEADRVRLALNEAGIQAVIHYVPLHTSGMGEKLGYSPDDLPVTTRAAESLLRLPLHDRLTIDIIANINSKIEELF